MGVDEFHRIAAEVQRVSSGHLAVIDLAEYEYTLIELRDLSSAYCQATGRMLNAFSPGRVSTNLMLAVADPATVDALARDLGITLIRPYGAPAEAPDGPGIDGLVDGSTDLHLVLIAASVPARERAVCLRVPVQGAADRVLPGAPKAAFLARSSSPADRFDLDRGSGLTDFSRR